MEKEIVQDDQKRYDFLKDKLFKKDETPKANASELDMAEFYELEDKITKPTSEQVSVEPDLCETIEGEGGVLVSEPAGEIPTLRALLGRIVKLEKEVAQNNVIIGGLQSAVHNRIEDNGMPVPEGADVRIGMKKVVDNVCGQPYAHYVPAG